MYLESLEVIIEENQLRTKIIIKLILSLIKLIVIYFEEGLQNYFIFLEITDSSKEILKEKQ